MTPTILYKQFHRYLPLNEMTGLQWFALSKNYGEVYGSISKSYRFMKNPKLLDIGDANVRTMIRETVEPFDPSIAKYSDPNEQYSGGPTNKKYHLLVQKYFGDTYDGTIIDENNLKGNVDYSAEDLDGASEVVLWKDFDQLLEEENINSTYKKGGTKRNCKKRYQKTICKKGGTKRSLKKKYQKTICKKRGTKKQSQMMKK